MVEDVVSGDSPIDDRLLGKLESFAERYPGSIYAKAALHSFNGGKDPEPVLSYFLERGGSLSRFGYPGSGF